MWLVVLALALGGFGIGTTEFVAMGLLPNIASDIGVDEPTAAHLISIYALGVVLYECVTGEKPAEVLERLHGNASKPLAEGEWPGFSRAWRAPGRVPCRSSSPQG